jgi:hypothetical protein
MRVFDRRELMGKIARPIGLTCATHVGGACAAFLLSSANNLLLRAMTRRDVGTVTAMARH